MTLSASEAIAAYTSAWRRKNSGSTVQGAPACSPVECVRVRNDVFDVTVTVEELQRMTRDILART